MKKLTALILTAAMLICLACPCFALSCADEPDEKPFENSEFFEYGDYSIHYRVFEAENAKANIFMIHGFAMSSCCWEELIPLLVDAGYTCVAADLPDFGWSTRETPEMTFLPREEIMHALMMSLDSAPWYVAGHSMGGFVALSMREKYPQDVKNLLLYGTSGNDGANAGLRSIMENNAFAEITGSFMELMGRCSPLVRILLAAAANDTAFAMKYDIKKLTAPYKIRGTGRGAIYSFSMLPVTDYESLKTASPVLFVNGDKDTVVTDSSRVNIRKALPEGSVDAVVENGGHLFIENMADTAAAITLDFLGANQT